MSKLLCKYAKQLRKHFVEGEKDLKKLLEDAGANAEEAADIERIAKASYKKSINKNKQAVLKKLFTDKKINKKSKAFEKLVDDLVDGKANQGTVRTQVAEAFNIPRLKPEKAKEISDLAAKVQKLPEGTERDLLQKQLSATIMSVTDPSLAEKAFAYSNLNILFAVRGRARDFISSGINYAVGKIDRSIATVLDSVISPLSKQKTSKFTGFARPSAYGKQFAEGFTDVTKRGFVDANSGRTLPLVFSEKNILGKAERILKGFMQGTDRANSILTATDSLIDQLAAKGIEPPAFKNFEDVQKWVRDIEAGKIKGIKPDDFLEMQSIAEVEGAAMSFRQPTAIKQVFSKLEKVDPVVAPYLFRFAGTMMNVLQTGVERSPLGFAKAFAKAGYDSLIKMPKGEISKYAIQRALTVDLAKALTGTFGAGAAGYGLSSMGVLKTMPPSNRKEAEGQGYKNKQYVKVGDYYFDPGFVTMLFPSVEQAAIGQQKGLKSQDFIDSILKTPVAAFGDQPVFRQIKKIISARSQEQQGQELAAFGTQTLGSFIPFTVMLGELARTIDPKAREIYAKNPIAAAKNRIQANLPGVSGALPQKYDELGKPEFRSPTPENTILGALNAFLNPVFVQKVQQDAVLNEAQKVFAATGEKEALPKYLRLESKSIPIKDINGNLIKVNLNGKQLQEMQKFTGEQVRQIMSGALGTPEFEELDDETKANVMGEVIKGSYLAAKIKLLKHNPKTASPIALAIKDGDTDLIADELQTIIDKQANKPDVGDQEYDGIQNE